MSSATRLLPIAALAFATLIASSRAAQGQADPGSSLPVGTTDTRGLIVLLEASGKLPGHGGARVRMQSSSDDLLVELIDDGRGVDAAAGDGILSAQLPGSLARGAAVRLLDEEDTVLWQDWLQVDDDVKQPRISFTFEGEQVQAVVLTQADTKRHGGGQKLVAPPPPTQNVTGLMVGMMLACLALGLVLGINLGPVLKRRLWRRKRSARSTNAAQVSLPTGLPPLDRPRLWVCPDDELRGQATMLVLEHLAQRHAVLVVLPAQRLETCGPLLDRLPVIMVPTMGRPSVSQLLAAWLEGGSGRPPIVLVEGLDALEETMQDEPRDAVVEELLDEAPSDAPLLVLLSVQDLELLGDRVDLALRSLPGGLGPEGGPVLLGEHPDGLIFAAPPDQELPAA